MVDSEKVNWFFIVHQPKYLKTTKNDEKKNAKSSAYNNILKNTHNRNQKMYACNRIIPDIFLLNILYELQVYTARTIDIYKVLNKTYLKITFYLYKKHIIKLLVIGFN